MDELIKGITIGIATVATIYLLTNFLGIGASYISSFFTRSIQGTWKTTFKENDNSYIEYARIRQIGPWVWGVIEYPDKKREYIIRGSFKHDILTATYEIKNNSSIIDRGAFTLVLKRFGNANKLTGYYSWTNDETNSPQSGYYEWQKMRSDKI